MITPNLDPNAAQNETEVTDELAGAIMQAGQHIVNAQPVPTNINIALQPTTAEPIIRLQFSTHQGVNIYFVSQEIARKIGVDLQKLGSEKKLSIISGTR